IVLEEAIISSNPFVEFFPILKIASDHRSSSEWSSTRAVPLLRSPSSPASVQTLVAESADQPSPSIPTNGRARRAPKARVPGRRVPLPSLSSEWDNTLFCIEGAESNGSSHH